MTDSDTESFEAHLNDVERRMQSSLTALVALRRVVAGERVSDREIHAIWLVARDCASRAMVELRDDVADVIAPDMIAGVEEALCAVEREDGLP